MYTILKGQKNGSIVLRRNKKGYFKYMNLFA